MRVSFKGICGFLIRFQVYVTVAISTCHATTVADVERNLIAMQYVTEGVGTWSSAGKELGSTDDLEGLIDELISQRKELGAEVFDSILVTNIRNEKDAAIMLGIAELIGDKQCISAIVRIIRIGNSSGVLNDDLKVNRVRRGTKGFVITQTTLRKILQNK
jgi:hypothetical protein